MNHESDATESDRGTFNVGRFIADQKLGLVHFQIVGIAMLAMLIEGYDLFIMGTIMPLIAEGFQVKPQAVAIALVGQQLGLALGAMFIVPFGDIVGRKTLVLVGFAGFGLFTLLGSFVGDLNTFALTRLGAGLTLGTFLPNLIALVREFAPSRHKATFGTILFVGFGIGSSLGAIITTSIAMRYGWETSFVVAGLAPLVVLPLVWLFLPESIAFRTLKTPNHPAIGRWIKRLNPAQVLTGNERFYMTEPSVQKESVLALFRDRNGLMTVMLMLSMGCSMTLAHLSAAWLPSIMMQKGGAALTDGAHFNSFVAIGGTLMTMLFGFLLDRLGALRVLIFSYVVTTLTYVALAALPAGSSAALLAGVVIGMFSMGGQSGLSALPSIFYQARVRTTASGWIFGVGRGFTLLGPFIGGAILASSLNYFSSVSIIAATSGAVVVFLTILILHTKRPEDLVDDA